MSNITFNLELNRKPNRNGLYEVFLRITENRKSSYVKTEVAVKAESWGTMKKVVSGGEIKEKRVTEHGSWVNRKDKEHEYKNRQLEKKIAEYRKAYDERKEENGYVNAAMVVNTVQQEYNLKDFLSFYDRKVSEMDNYNNSKGYTTTRRHIATYLDKNKLSHTLDFRQVNPDFLRGFERYLKGNGLDTDSQYSNLKRIRRVFNLAIKAGVIDKSVYPFDAYEMPRVTQNVKTKLTADEVKSFASVKYPKDSRLFHTQNAFMLSLRCGGIRVEDLLSLKVRNVANGRITYSMSKGVTGGKVKSIRVTDKIQSILNHYITMKSKPNDYLFPFLPEGSEKLDNEAFKKQIGSKTSQMNQDLKLIASDAKIEKNVTTHIARHSWASIAKKQTKDLKAIQEVLGHSSLKITEAYLESVDLESQDEMMSSVDI